MAIAIRHLNRAQVEAVFAERLQIAEVQRVRAEIHATAEAIPDDTPAGWTRVIEEIEVLRDTTLAAIDGAAGAAEKAG